MRKHVVYTALFGEYDNVIDVNKFKSYSKFSIYFILYTNNDNDNYYKSLGWDVIKFGKHNENGIKLNRIIKFSDKVFNDTRGDYFLYVDSNILLTEQIFDNFEKLITSNIVLQQHPRKHTLKDEIIYCKKISKINYFSFFKIIKFYSTKTDYLGVCISENSLFFWKPTTDLFELFVEINYLLNEVVFRDQLFLNYLLQKKPINNFIIDKNLLDYSKTKHNYTFSFSERMSNLFPEYIILRYRRAKNFFISIIFNISLKYFKFINTL
jgi:hypothetical protein